MLGFLIDSDEFEVKPAISRAFIVNESLGGATFKRTYISKTIDVVISTIVAGENQTTFSVGESINVLFNVAINGLVQEKDIHYRHLGGTSNIIFDLAGTPSIGDVVTVSYYKGKGDVMYDQFGNILQVGRERFIFNGNDLTFTLSQKVNSIINITFGYYFNQPIDNLPNQLVHLTLGACFNQNIAESFFSSHNKLERIIVYNVSQKKIFPLKYKKIILARI
jgi:hypothetical protein